jgi:ethanolamine ammonia-lyase small subunit
VVRGLALTRDALLRPLDEEKLAADLAAASGLEVLRIASAARDLDEFLLRPDLGRRLHDASVERLDAWMRSEAACVLFLNSSSARARCFKQLCRGC